MFSQKHFLIWILFVSEFSNKQKTPINPFSPNTLSTPNFSLHNTYKIWHLVIRKWELIKQSKLLKIKSKILSNFFNEKYGLKLGEFNNTTGTERVKKTYSKQNIRSNANFYGFGTTLWSLCFIDSFLYSLYHGLIQWRTTTRHSF